MAERVGPGRDDYSTEFSPANAALWEIAVAVELGDAGRALRAASAVDASGLSRQVVHDLLAMQTPPSADLTALAVRVAAQ